ncbi:uncharacterized protein LOC123899096 [Trifolium pratense]|uniref:Uncharacterized protein n=1 Tax=Trifolium pratense TaxID=57577 RepID=A0ACB0JN22_TRIPR|nr:uncharacterized protein LOC123899096 [Trifolium pratense]CAJ2645375.1 unnamed protein product [Trifolium pratense]
MESPNTIPPINTNKNKRHLFKCFKPDDVVESPRRKARTNSDPLLSYLVVAEKQGMVLPTMLSSTMTGSKGGAPDGSASRRRKFGKEKSHRLRQAIIRALNHTSLGKKFINRTKINNNENTWSKSSRFNKLEGEGDKISNTNHKEEPQRINSFNDSSSHHSPTFTPSTLSSSTCSSRSQGSHIWGFSSELYPTTMNGIEVKQEVVECRKYFGLNMGLCLLFLTSLLVLTLLGKFCAILCTSIGFFVVHYWQKKWCNEEDMCEESIEFDSARCKRLIMEDLSKKEL